MHVMSFHTFKNDVSDVKVEATKLFARPGGNNSSFVYIMPPKFLALKQGDGAQFLQETSFSSADNVTLPPPSPPPVYCEIYDLQQQVKSLESQIIRTNRNFKIFGSLFLVLMTTFILAGLSCLMVGLKVPFFMQFLEEVSWAFGLGNEEDLDTQPKLSLNLVVPSETSTCPLPEVINVDTAEDGNSLIWDLTPWGRTSI